MKKAIIICPPQLDSIAVYNYQSAYDISGFISQGTVVDVIRMPARGKYALISYENDDGMICEGYVNIERLEFKED